MDRVERSLAPAMVRVMVVMVGRGRIGKMMAKGKGKRRNKTARWMRVTA